ncbi:MAG: DUF2924 domain-containing protein, partial [Holosporales bacterium]|nr:DUF2924 domain-containing protein [Holosporales bacterium]
PIKDLKKAWKEKTGIEPPPHMQKRALIERLAYKIQELAFGGLSKEAQERRELYEQRLQKREPLLEKPCLLPPGSLLTRDYDNHKHVVKILEEEKVEYKGLVYNSLSAVAREITGTRWNGLKFFHVERRSL